MDQLPAVAKNVYTFCKKCDADRYHIVVAHKSDTSAKVKCEVCGSHKTYTLPKPGGEVKRAPKGAAAAKKAASENSRRNQHAAEYEGLLAQHESKPVQKYNIKGKFELNHKLDHPTFGLGLIKSVYIDKIEVVFADEVRSLVHNRGA